MDFEVGQRIIRGSNGKSGFIHAIEKRRALMLEVRWEEGETKQWIQAQEVRLWDKLSEPVVAPPSQQPSAKYELELWELNAKLREERRAYWKSKKEAERLADTLAGLSTKRKVRSRKKARRFSAKFEKENNQRKPIR